MILTKKQEESIRIAVDRYRRGERYTCIAGFAGTGKTTVLSHIIQSLPGINPQTDVCCCSFTGKAVKVLEKKGLPNTLTLHKLLYKFWVDKYGVSHHSLVEEIPYKIVCVDEISMCSADLINDLAKFKVHIICLGDPEQLPPPMGKDNLLLTSPHIFLDEIMRQEEENTIIRLSKTIRQGGGLPEHFESDNVIILPKRELNTGMLLWSDICLCATNKMRKDINNQIRTLKGFEGELQDGENVMCLSNYWEHPASNGADLTNGTFGVASNVKKFTTVIPNYIRSRIPVETKEFPIYYFNFTSVDNDDFGTITADRENFISGQHGLPSSDEYLLSVNKKYKKLVPMYFDYSYAITTHRSQGSEWDKVLIIEEQFPYGKEEHRKWLYTAVTRSSGKVVLVR